ncbi:hypothetical protein BDP27DRAFT_417740 [Rhodocollybia butyracea]|uniref:DUF6533 domain-containing protein n=1 Tax=Rhodocollybia butyracea TaxID=206335 RepID=A0A9P5P7W2_9AGAR|nr:hypothetical protein BDP27DRAFT_417740 [Rhodocollybia butyracea]
MAVAALVVSSLIDSQIVVYTQVAMLTLLTYDYILSLGQEVAYIWVSNWGLVKVLYFLLRYSPFIDTILAIEEKLNPHVTSASCRRTMTFNTLFADFGIGTSHLILIIRTYALYQQSRKIFTILMIPWTIAFVLNVIAAIKWSSNTLAFSESITLVGGSSCFPIGQNKTGLITDISLLVGETVLVAFTLRQCFRESHSYLQNGFFRATQSVVVTFYLDGVLFYMCILPITVGNTLVTVYAPAQLQILETPLRVIHAILCCKLIIHVREIANPPDDQTRHLSTLFCHTNHSSASEISEV